MKYKPKYRPGFAADVRKHAHLRARIEKKCLSITEDPYHNTEPLEDRGGIQLKGVRSKRIDRNFRILFAVCEECRRIFSESEDCRACKHCVKTLPDNTIIFFAVGPHEKIYSRGKPLD